MSVIRVEPDVGVGTGLVLVDDEPEHVEIEFLGERLDDGRIDLVREDRVLADRVLDLVPETDDSVLGDAGV